MDPSGSSTDSEKKFRDLGKFLLNAKYRPPTESGDEDCPPAEPGWTYVGQMHIQGECICLYRNNGGTMTKPCV